MTGRKKHKVKNRYPFRYRGSLFWFIFFIILFLPIAVVLFVKNSSILKNDHYYSFSYNGSYGWLYFWAIIFFPIMILLFVLNGVDVVEEG